MKLFGHPVHVMLVHFPIALWPAHLVLHGAAAWLPNGVAAVAGFWLLVAGTALGWAAAGLGAADLLVVAREAAVPRFRAGLVHGAVNGAALVVFTALTVLEYAAYPTIAHGRPLLTAEAVVIVAMFAGNYFGAVARGESASSHVEGQRHLNHGDTARTENSHGTGS